jgi:hypothetical protein
MICNPADPHCKNEELLWYITSLGAPDHRQDDGRHVRSGRIGLGAGYTSAAEICDGGVLQQQAARDKSG